MADISLQLDTTQYPLTIVNGTTLTLSLSGAAGPSGPNTVTTSTSTDLNGYIYGDGTTVAGATAATSFNVGDTLVKRDGDGNFSGEAITAENHFFTYGDVFTGNLALANGSYYNQFRSETLTATRIISLPNANGTVALTDVSQNWSGTQTFSGAMVFTSTTRPTSSGTGTPAATSLITRDDGDTRYSRVQDATVATIEQTGTNTTTYVDSTQGRLTLAVGTYIIETWQQVEGTGANPSGCSAKTKLRWTGTATASGLRFMAGGSTASPYNQNAAPVMSQGGSRVFDTEVAFNYSTNYGGINHLRFKFVVTVAGTLYIQFAPAAAVASQLCSLHVGSFLRATQIA